MFPETTSQAQFELLQDNGRDNDEQGAKTQEREHDVSNWDINENAETTGEEQTDKQRAKKK